MSKNLSSAAVVIGALRVKLNLFYFGRFTFERIQNTKEQIYFYERAENHKAKERMFKSFK